MTVDVAARAGFLTQTKVIRRVRTEAGVRRYKQPIGSIIINNGLLVGLTELGVDEQGRQVLEGANGKKYTVHNEGSKTNVFKQVWVAREGDNGKGKVVVRNADRGRENELETLVELARIVQEEAGIDTTQSGLPGSGSGRAANSWSQNQIDAVSDELASWGNTATDNGNGWLADQLWATAEQLDEHRDIRLTRFQLEELKKTEGQGLDDTMPGYRDETPVEDREKFRDLIDYSIRTTVDEGKLPKKFDQATEAEYAAGASARATERASKPTPLKTADIREGQWIRPVDNDGKPTGDWFQVRRISSQSVSGRSKLIDGIDRAGKRVAKYQQGPRNKWETIKDPKDQPSYEAIAPPPSNVVKKIQHLQKGDFTTLRGTDQQGKPVTDTGYVNDYPGRDDYSSAARKKSPVYRVELADDKKGTNKRIVIVPKGSTTGPAADDADKPADTSVAAPVSDTGDKAKLDLAMDILGTSNTPSSELGYVIGWRKRIAEGDFTENQKFADSLRSRARMLSQDLARGGVTDTSGVYNQRATYMDMANILDPEGAKDPKNHPPTSINRERQLEQRTARLKRKGEVAAAEAIASAELARGLTPEQGPKKPTVEDQSRAIVAEQEKLRQTYGAAIGYGMDALPAGSAAEKRAMSLLASRLKDGSVKPADAVEQLIKLRDGNTNTKTKRAINGAINALNNVRRNNGEDISASKPEAKPVVKTPVATRAASVSVPKTPAKKTPAVPKKKPAAAPRQTDGVTANTGPNIEPSKSEYPEYEKYVGRNGRSFYLEDQEDGTWVALDANDEELAEGTRLEVMRVINGLGEGGPKTPMRRKTPAAKPAPAADVRNLRSAQSEYAGWEKFLGDNDTPYYVRQEGRNWVAVDADDADVVPAGTRNSVLAALDALAAPKTPAARAARVASPRQAKPKTPEGLTKQKDEYQGWERFKGDNGTLYDVGRDPGDDTWYATGMGGWDEVVAEGATREEVMEKLVAVAAPSPVPVTFSPNKPVTAPVVRGGNTTPEARIVDAYRSLAKKPGSYVDLVALRKKLPDMSKAEQDAAILRLNNADDVKLETEPLGYRITPEVTANAVEFAGEDMHKIAIGNPDDETFPDSSPIVGMTPAQVEAARKRRNAQLARSVTGSGSSIRGAGKQDSEMTPPNGWSKEQWRTQAMDDLNALSETIASFQQSGNNSELIAGLNDVRRRVLTGKATPMEAVRWLRARADSRKHQRESAAMKRAANNIAGVDQDPIDDGYRSEAPDPSVSRADAVRLVSNELNYNTGRNGAGWSPAVRADVETIGNQLVNGSLDVPEAARRLNIAAGQLENEPRGDYSAEIAGLRAIAKRISGDGKPLPHESSTDMPAADVALGIADMAQGMTGIPRSNADMIVRATREGQLTPEQVARVLNARAKEMSDQWPGEAAAFRDMASRITDKPAPAPAAPRSAIQEAQAGVAQVNRNMRERFNSTLTPQPPVGAELPMGTATRDLETGTAPVVRNGKPLNAADRRNLNMDNDRVGRRARLITPDNRSASIKLSRYGSENGLAAWNAIQDRATENYLRGMTRAAAWSEAIDAADRRANPDIIGSYHAQYRDGKYYTVVSDRNGKREIGEHDTRDAALGEGNRLRQQAIFDTVERLPVVGDAMNVPVQPRNPRSDNIGVNPLINPERSPEGAIKGSRALDAMTYEERMRNIEVYTQQGPNFNRATAEGYKYAWQKNERGLDYDLDLTEAEAAAGLRPREDVAEKRNASMRTDAAWRANNGTGIRQPAEQSIINEAKLINEKEARELARSNPERFLRVVAERYFRLDGSFKNLQEREAYEELNAYANRLEAAQSLQSRDAAVQGIVSSLRIGHAGMMGTSRTMIAIRKVLNEEYGK
jgi:hypothetical protein